MLDSFLAAAVLRFSEQSWHTETTVRSLPGVVTERREMKTLEAIQPIAVILGIALIAVAALADWIGPGSRDPGVGLIQVALMLLGLGTAVFFGALPKT